MKPLSFQCIVLPIFTLTYLLPYRSVSKQQYQVKYDFENKDDTNWLKITPVALNVIPHKKSVSWVSILTTYKFVKVAVKVIVSFFRVSLFLSQFPFSQRAEAVVSLDYRGLQWIPILTSPKTILKPLLHFNSPSSPATYILTLWFLF